MHRLSSWNMFAGFQPTTHWAWFFLFICPPLLVLSTGCNRAANPQVATDGQADAAEAQAEPIHVREARQEIWPETVRVQGSLLGDDNSLLGSRLAGMVETVPVDLGDVVQQGATLVRFDQRDLKLRVQQAEAQLNQACAAIGLDPADSELELNRDNSPPVMLERAMVEEATAAFGRAQQLRAKQAISEGEYDRLEALMKTAQARFRSAYNSVGEQIALIGLRRVELAVARQALQDSEILAPFTGIVAKRHVSPGEYVQPGQALVDLIRTDRLRFTAGVPERQAGKIALGQAVLIRLPGRATPLITQISRISPLVTLSSRSLMIEADLANPELKLQAGLFAEAEIVVDPATESLTVPIKAVAEFAGVQKVWLVQGQQAEERPVRTGRRDGKRIEILSGLEAGNVIVRNFAEGHAGEIATVMKTPRPEAHETVAGTTEEAATAK